MKKDKRVFILILSMIILLSSGFSNLTSLQVLASDEKVAVPVTSENTYEKTEFYNDNLFGVSGGFHLVGFTSVTTQSHAHGNIMTNQLHYNSNFGTRNNKEVSYIKSLASPVSGLSSTDGNSGSILVVGKGIKVGTADNGRNFSLDGQKVDNPARYTDPDALWQDDEAEFIDMEKERQFVIEVNQRLRNTPDYNTTVNLSDRNNQYVEIDDPTGISYATVDADAIQRESSVTGQGFQRGKQGILVLNVDLKGKSSFDFQGSIIKYTDGSTAPTGEVSYWQDGNIVWNFFDSSQPDGLYRGSLQNGRTTAGHILAPAAKVSLIQGLNGTVIADEIIVIAESHKTDITSFTEVSVSKRWVGTPSDAVKIRLFGDGVFIKEVELNETTNWRYTFKNLPKYRVSDKQKIAYTIEEVDLDGYSSNITGNAADGFVITNTKKEETEKISIPVEKVWVGKPAKEVNVNLLADGILQQQIVLNDANEWKYVFKDLDKFDKMDGHEIVYTITEDKIDGYQSAITGSAANGFIITNTEGDSGDERMSIPVVKEWIGTPTDEITIRLIADGIEIKQVKLNPANAWKYTFKDLRKYAESDLHEIAYKVEEIKIDGYTSRIIGNINEGITIINEEITPVIDKISIPVSKKWVGTPASEVTIKLLADGKEIEHIDLSETNGWKHTFKDLNKVNKATGKNILYTIEEVKIDGYDSLITGDMDKGYVVTNTKIPEDKISIPVEKKWVGTPASEVTIKLLADNKDLMSVTLNDANAWKHIFKDLPKFDRSNGHEIIYSIKEMDIDNYTSKITGNSSDGFVITNTFVQETTEFTVNKKWVGGPDIKPTIEVQLYRNGQPYGDSVFLENGTLSYTWKDLEISDFNGNEYKYTVDEINPPTGYSKSVDGMNITNEYTPGKVALQVEKIWVGGPKDTPEIQIQLLRNGKAYGDLITLASGSTRYLWKDLDATDASGKPYKYSVDEINVPKGYKKTISGNTITNTYSENPTTVTPKPKQPKTGINNDISLYVLAVLVAGSTATVIVRNRKKKHQ